MPFDRFAKFVPKFGVGQSVCRKEDPRLLRGDGNYTDDYAPQGMVHARFVRSDHAHGIIKSVDLSVARGMAGVLLAMDSSDLVGHGYRHLGCGLPLTGTDGSPLIVPDHPSLAQDKVYYAGQPMAVIIAETAAIAEAAAELAEIVIEPLPALVDMADAIKDGADSIHGDAPGNVALDWSFGDHDAVAAAFNRASHITKLTIRNNRIMVAPMEPRGAIISYEGERWTVKTGCQGTFGMRGGLAGLLGVDAERVRVLADDIGGSFGMKASPFPEHLPILHAARVLGRPIRWMNDRSESFLADYHGRDSVYDAELALDQEGNFLAVRLDGLGSVGAFCAGFGPGIPTMVVQKNLPGMYKTPLMAMRTRLVMTNTTPLTAYRGAGRPEAVYIMERLVETAAREMGLNPLSLRRQNLIAPEAMPYHAPSGVTYDSGDFAGIIDRGLHFAQWNDFAGRRAASEARGKIRGIGFASYLEITAAQGKEMGGIGFGNDGRITLTTGTLDYGQGHASTFAQVVAEKLGLPFEAIGLEQNDSDKLLFGGGTGGSRSMMASSQALLTAADEVIEKGRKLAADIMEAAPGDIIFDAGEFRVAGTDKCVPILKLAGEYPGEMDVALVADTPPSSCPNGVHIAEVEIDPETGAAVLVKYAAVDDFGVIVNPLLVEGQVHGGVVQAIGQAMGENAVYDGDGQLLSGSFMDYYMPRADTLPDFELDFRPTRATTNKLGVKGCGEAGISAALPAVMNAVLDALKPYGIEDLDMPATPENIWRAMHK